MRVSELSKELGYRAAELVALAKVRNLPIKSVRDNVDARKAALIRAQLPHRSKLDDELKALYEQIQEQLKKEEEERKSRKKAAPAKPRKRKTTTRQEKEEGPEEGKKTSRKKKDEKEETPEEPKPRKLKPGDLVKPAPSKPEPPARKTPAAAEKKTKAPPRKKEKVISEFRLGGEGGKSGGKGIRSGIGDRKLTGANRPARAGGAKPLIDVNKVIGEEKDIRAVRSSELDQGDKTAKRVRRPDPGRGRRVKGPPIARPTIKVKKTKQIVIDPSERDYTIQVPITLKEFSQSVGLKVSVLIRKMMGLGQMLGMNAVLDADTVQLLSEEFNRKVKIVQQKKAEDRLIEESEEQDKPEDLEPRPPVVTFLGHVDHGKTSLLDRLRDSDVAKGEAGGITQHIGAYKVQLADDREIVFLDTPGHEAFTEMRSRGARATDLVVLVVAADDGVMPQTEEAYNHAKAAEVPIIVALNKMDRPDADPNKVKGQLSTLGLQPEDWGGETSLVEVSAINGDNMDKLLETILLEAEMLELKANPKRPARGVVLEARKTGDRGAVATILVQEGTLRRGDVVLTGRAFGRMRQMTDHRGKAIREAMPATPVEISGLDEVPAVGDMFQVVSDVKKAKAVIDERRRKDQENERLEKAKHVTIENLFSQIESGKVKEVRVIVKADAGGSAEVLKSSLEKLSTDEVKLSIIHAAVGSVSESDVLLADASDAIIVAFYVETDSRAAQLSKDKAVQIRTYQVIYEAIEEMEAALEGLLEPERVQVRQGLLAVKEIFRISRVGTVAGCLVTNGKIERSSHIRLVRNGKVVHEGRLESLKRIKDDVREVAEGYECGVKIAGHDDVRSGDVIEAVTTQEIARKLQKRS